MTTKEERDAQVRAVLLAAKGPMTPTAIAAQIAKEWCCYGGKPAYASSAPVSAVLKRIGAVAVRRGLWVAAPKLGEQEGGK